MPRTDPTLWQSLGQAIAGQATDFRAFDGPALLTAARAHGVSPLLADARHRGTATGLAPLVEDGIRQDTHHQAALDLVLTRETRHCLAVLAEAGVPVLLLKGAALAQLHYAKSWLRPRCDADLYIAEDSVQPAADCLAAAGYRVLGREADRHSVKQFHASRRSFQGEAIVFDLHYRISNRALFRDCLPYEEADRGARPVPALGEYARAPADAVLLCHAALHRIAHARNAERDRLLWLYDIHRLALDLDDTQSEPLAELALAQGLGAVLGDALATCRDLFNTPVTPGLMERLLSRADREPAARLLRSGKLSWVLSDLRGEGGLAGKLGLLQELLANRLESPRPAD